MGLSAEDQLAIQQLYARYCHAVDHNDHDAWAACIATDGTLRFNIPGGGPNLKGPDAFRAYSMAGAERLRNTRHVIANLVVEESSEGVRGTCYLILYDVANTSCRIILTGRYEDRLVQEDGRWKFKSRLLHVDQAWVSSLL